MGFWLRDYSLHPRVSDGHTSLCFYDRMVNDYGGINGEKTRGADDQ
jgi:hypothetical protein